LDVTIRKADWHTGKGPKMYEKKTVFFSVATFRIRVAR
jgi:hypothetical protein